MEDIYTELEFLMTQCDMDFCPPPLFDLPPPPPPPWMENPPSCHGECGGGPAQVSSINNVQEIFHSISIIVVSAFVIVLTLLFFAVLIWRRRVILMRKFGSRSSLPQSQADVNSVVGTGKKNGHSGDGSVLNSRTLPNHYISDRQLVTDAAGRSTMQLIRATPVSTAHSPSSTLMIGGMPFHIIESKPEGLNQGPQLMQQQLIQGHGVGLNHVYPVYETIESDYNCSEKSSMYSDNSSNGTGYTLQQLISNTSTSTAGVPHTSMAGVHHHAAQQSNLSNASYMQTNYTYASNSADSTAYAYATGQEVNNVIFGHPLGAGASVASGSSGQLFYPIQQQHQQRFLISNQMQNLGQQQFPMFVSTQNLYPTPLAPTSRPTTLNGNGQAPLLLRNLPASRRVKSFRHPTATTANDAVSRPPPPLPLPPIPTSESTAVAPPSASVHESTISLKNMPDPKSNITQL